MEDIKPSQQCSLKTTHFKSVDCQINEDKEIVLDLTGCESDCDQKEDNRLINDIPLKLPQKNSGIEQKSSKNSRTKLKMLGNLTFREIAEKRKEMVKSSSFKSFENDTASSKLLPLSEGSLNSHKQDDEKNQETTYINPHALVGKTITLDQGNIRCIKFLSQDSKTSLNKRKLKKLTPKIIVKKSRPKCLPSSYIQRNNEDPIKIYDYQKVRNHKGVYSVKNSVKLNVQVSFESPNTHSTSHGHHLPNDESEKGLTRTYPELLMQNPSFNENVYKSMNANFVDTQGKSEKNMDECSFLNSSHDSLTILSQVACGELEMSQKLGCKGENKYSPTFRERNQDFQQIDKKPNYDHIFLDHSYEQKRRPENHSVRKKGFATVGQRKTKTSTRKRDESFCQLPSQKGKTFIEKKPMFAWCTQYITHSRPIKESFAEQHELPTNQELKCFGEINKPLRSYDSTLKTEKNLQRQDYTSNETSLKTLSPIKSSKKTLKTEEKSSSVPLTLKPLRSYDSTLKTEKNLQRQDYTGNETSLKTLSPIKSSKKTLKTEEKSSSVPLTLKPLRSYDSTLKTEKNLQRQDYTSNETSLKTLSPIKSSKKTLKTEEKSSSVPLTLKPLRSYDSTLKTEKNLQRQDYTSNETILKTLSPIKSSKKTLKTEENSSSMPLTLNMSCGNEITKSSCLGRENIENINTKVMTEQSLLTKRIEVPEVNDEVIILKEVLVSKSLNCCSTTKTCSNISKLKNQNKHNYCETDSQRSTLEKNQSLLVKKSLIEIPANKPCSINDGDKNITSPCIETAIPSLANNSSQLVSKNVNSNIHQQKIRNKLNPVITSAECQTKSSLIEPQESCHHNSKCDCISTSEKIIPNPSLGKASYPIKNCVVLVERLKLSTPLLVTRIACSTPKPMFNKISYDSFLSNISPGNHEMQSKVCEVYNSESKFENTDIVHRHQFLPTYSKEKETTEVSKAASEVNKPPVLLFIKKSNTNLLNDLNKSKTYMFKPEISAFTVINEHTESHIGNVSGVSRICFQEDKGNLVVCHETERNVKTKSHCEESLSPSSLHEHDFGSKQHIAIDAVTNRKRKLKDTKQYSGCFKKIKLPRGRPKKPIAKHSKTTLKKREILKSKYENASVKTENSQEIVKKIQVIPNKLIEKNINTILKTKKILISELDNASEETENCQEKVKRPRGRPRKFIDKTTLKVRKVPKSKPSDDTGVKTKMCQETNRLKKDEEGVNSNQNADSFPIYNMSNIVNSPDKNFSGNREIYSLLSDFTTLGCTIEPERKLRKRLSNIPVKSTENIEILNYSTQKKVRCNENIQDCVKIKLDDCSMNETNLTEKYRKSSSQNIASPEDKSVKLLSKNVIITESTPANQSCIETVISKQTVSTQNDVGISKTECHIVPQVQEGLPSEREKFNCDHSPSQIQKQHTNDIESNTVEAKENVLTLIKPSSLSKSVIKKSRNGNKKLDLPKSMKKQPSKSKVKVNKKVISSHIVPQVQEGLPSEREKFNCDHSPSQIQKQHTNDIESNTVEAKENVLTLKKPSSISKSVMKKSRNDNKKLHLGLPKSLKKQPSNSKVKVNKKVISTFSSRINSENLRSPKATAKQLKIFKETKQSRQQSHPKKLSCDQSNVRENERSMPAKVRQIRGNSRRLKSRVLNSKQANSNNAGELLDLKTCSLLLTPELTNQTWSVERKTLLSSCISINERTKLCPGKKKSVCSESNIPSPDDKKFDQKVTIAENISNDQISNSYLDESNSTTECAKKQLPESCKKINKLSQNNLQPQAEYLRKKTTVNNSTASSATNITTDPHKSINRLNNASTKNIICKPSTSNSKQKEDEHLNNQKSNHPALSGNIRLLIKEQLKKKSSWKF